MDPLQDLTCHHAPVGQDTPADRIVPPQVIRVRDHLNHLFREPDSELHRAAMDEPGAQSQHQIAFGDEIVDRIVGPDPLTQTGAQGERMVLGEGVLGAVSGDHGDSQSLGQTDQGPMGPAVGQFLTGPDQGPLGSAQGGHDLLQVLLARSGRFRIGRPPAARTAGRSQEVVGKLEDGGTPPASGQRGECFVHGRRQVRRVLHPAGMSGHRPEHPKLFLGFVDQAQALLPLASRHGGGQMQQGRAGMVGLAHRVHGVGRAGPGAADQDAGTGAGTSVAVGHESATQFRPSTDMAHPVLVAVEGVEDIQVVDGDDAEKEVDAVERQTLHQCLAAGPVGHFRCPGIRRGRPKGTPLRHVFHRGRAMSPQEFRHAPGDRSRD